MFERFSKSARRAVFFARYEAGAFGASQIDTQHLLLGLLREDRSLSQRYPVLDARLIRTRIEEFFPPPASATVVAGDLDLTACSQRALEFAAELSQRLRCDLVETGHILAGLLRTEESLAARVLMERGLELTPPGGEA